MNNDNVILMKTYAFAVRIVRLYQSLAKEYQEYVLSKQVLKSGTSIGANAEEAIGAQSKKDFKSKLSITYKEARETRYRLRLLRDTGFLKPPLAQSLLSDYSEILKIIGSVIKTLKKS